MPDIFISGGVLLVCVLIPYAGYKLYKKCAVGGNNNRRRRANSELRSLLLCCPRGRGQDALDAASTRRKKKVVPRVELDFPPNLRVGTTVSFRVIFPPGRQERRSTPQPSTSSSRPPPQPIILDAEDYDLDQLSIEVKKVHTSFSSSQSSASTIPIIRELIPQPRSSSSITDAASTSEASNKNNGDVLLVKFLVQEAGFYQISILYDGQHVPGSPFPTPFNPAEMDAEKTACIRDAPIMVNATGDILRVFINPMDRYGNECNYGDVNTSLFFLQMYQQIDKEQRVLLEPLVFNFTREIRKTVSTNEQSSSSITNQHQVQVDQECLQVMVEAEVFEHGIFQAVITYDGTKLKNGTFDLVSLSAGENNTFREIMASTLNPTSRYYEARLLAIGQETFKKPKQIFLYICSRTLTIKEYFLFGVIPVRLATFRILPLTTVQVLSLNKESNTHVLAISDRSQTQPKIIFEMEVTMCRLLLAMFSDYLRQRLGGSEAFENKQSFFYEEFKREKDVLRTTPTMVTVSRGSIVNSSLLETKGFSGKDWCKHFKVKFAGEEGSDDGGLRREWLNQLCKEMFDCKPDGMFCSIGNSRLVHPNPSRDQDKWGLKHYEFAGKIVGKCLYETAMGGFYKQMVNARFTRSFLGQIIGFPLHYKYFEQDDPEFYMGKIKYILDSDDMSSMDLTFVEEEYNSTNGQLLKSVELMPNGKRIPVTNENKKQYLNLLAQYRLLTRVKREIESFMKGLNEVVPEGLLTNFDENELEVLMCGKSTFSVEDLKAHHVTTGTGYHYTTTLPWFWLAVTNMTDEERGRLLQFTTGSSLLPHGGFASLQPTFRITITDTFGKLPIAHTCFSEICLSVHRNFEEFEKFLRIAINEGSEGFGFL